MKKPFWVFVVLAILIVIFSVKNAQMVLVDVLFSKLEISLAFLVILVFITGLITGALFVLLSNRIKAVKQKKTEKSIPDESNEQ